MLCFLSILTGCRSASNTPPYGISFQFEHSGWPSPDTKAYQDAESIIARAYSWQFDKKSSPPSMPVVFGMETARQHWLTLIVMDPDNLAYRWQKDLTNEEFVEEERHWREAPRGYHFSFDLRDWVPEGFQWKAGLYRVSGLASVGKTEFPVSGGVLFMKAVPSRFRQPVPLQPRIGPAAPLLKGELKINKETFKPGEIIVLEGLVQNVSEQPLMIQTQLPFLEARLVASPGLDTFPKERPNKALRLSDFSRIAPGEKLVLFKESFVAGKSDADWVTGMRRDWFPTPFAGRNPIDLSFELFSNGIFPRDRQPDCGIWTGQLKSNRITTKTR